MAIDEKYKVKLEERLEIVKENIARAAVKSGRSAADITLIGVSKYFPPEAAVAAVECGLADLGENRVQEFLEKSGVLAEKRLFPNWHLIGTLQTNKIKYILGKISLIHSVDRLRLLQELDKQSRKAGLTTDILLQVNAGRETSKHGFMPEEIISSAEKALSLQNIRLCGLMAMAPLSDDPESLRPLFISTREMFDRIKADLRPGPEFSVISMGMTQDYVQAIECGATHVRIGTAIFGPRL